MPIAYAYCAVPRSFDIGTGIVGIDDVPVQLVTAGELGALISLLDYDTYRADFVEACVQDVEWLKPRAVAHDRVVTWASDRAATVPFPMWTMFAEPSGVVTLLDERRDIIHAALTKVRDAREYTVRIFVRQEQLLAAAATLSPRLVELERAAASASPGQAYLLKSKLANERKVEARALGRQVADDAYAALSVPSTEAIRETLPQNEGEGQGGSAILNASFLVRSGMYDRFREVLTDLVTRYESFGFRIDFTGPWPAYHFVRVA